MKRLWPLPVLFLLLAAPVRAQEDGEAGSAPQEETLAPPEGEVEPEEPQPQGGAEANAEPGAEAGAEDGAKPDAEEAEAPPVKEKEEPLISVEAASSEPEEYDEEEGVEIPAPKKKVVPTATLKKAPPKGKPAAKAVKAVKAKPAEKMAPPPVPMKKKPAVAVAAEPPRPLAPAVPLTPITPRNP